MNTPTNLTRRPQTIRSSLRTAINRRIRWGSTSASGQKRAGILRECNDSVVMELANRSSIEESIQCLVFNKECHCRISPNETLFLDRCLPRVQLYVMHIIPFVSSVLDLFVFRELITLGPDGNSWSNQVAWVMLPLVSIGIAIALFSTHCYNYLLGAFVFGTSGVLALFVYHDCTENTMVAENEGRVIIANRLAPPPESADNDPKSWKEIL
jgi:hypothetical protein